MRAMVRTSVVLVAGLAVSAAAAAPARPVQTAGCPSLANLRILAQRSQDDAAAAAAILSDPKADHLGCSLLEPARIVAVSERLALGGREYECLTLQGTGVCYWIPAGAVAPGPASPPVRAPAERTKR